MKNSINCSRPSAFHIILLFSFTIQITNSCSDKIELKNYKEDYNYYPVRIGSIWEYNVDSIIFSKPDDLLQIDSINYKIREIITDSIRLNGKLVYLIEKYKRLNDIVPWEISSVYTTQFESNQIFRTEENQRFIKLFLPLEKDLVWNANSYINEDTEVIIAGESINIFKGWESKTTEIDKSYNNAWMNFDSTVCIELVNKKTLLDIRQGYEVYARNYGLVYRYLKVLDTQCNGDPNACKDIPWEQKADKGFIVIQRLTGYKW